MHLHYTCIYTYIFPVGICVARTYLFFKNPSIIFVSFIDSKKNAEYARYVWCIHIPFFFLKKKNQWTWNLGAVRLIRQFPISNYCACLWARKKNANYFLIKFLWNDFLYRFNNNEIEMIMATFWWLKNLCLPTRTIKSTEQSHNIWPV